MYDYRTSNNKGFKYMYIIIDKFSKFLWALPLRIKYGQSITNDIAIVLTKSKRKPLKIESDRGAEFYNNIFQSFFKKIYITILVLLVKVHGWQNESSERYVVY